MQSTRCHLRPLVAIALAAACSGGDSGNPNDPGNPSTSCSNPLALPLSGSLSGSVGGSKPCNEPSAGGGEGYPYSLTLAQPTNLEVALATSSFSPYLGVFTAAGELVTQTNSSTNSYKPMRAKLFLAAGSYRVWVGSLNGSGSFTLTSAPTALDGCVAPGLGYPPYPDQGNAVKGVTITGSVATSDCSAPVGSIRFDVYIVYLKAGTTLNLSVTVDRAATLYTSSRLESGWNTTKPMTGAGTWTTSITATSNGYVGVRLEATTVPVAYTVILN